MKKKTNSGEETIKSIRRNSAYNSSRTLVLIFCVVLGLSMLATAYWLSQILPQNAQIAVLFIAVLLGVLSGVNLFHFLHAHYDQSDALIKLPSFKNVHSNIEIMHSHSSKKFEKKSMRKTSKSKK
jgi:hypothetical protein